MDAQVQDFTVAHLRRRPSAVETGGFVVGIDPGSTGPYANYATPLPGSAPGAGDVAALVEAFRAHGLRPRLVYVPAAAPAVEAALRAAGFRTEAVHDYLVCTPATLTPPPPAAPPVRVRSPRTRNDYTAVNAALAEVFGGEPGLYGAAGIARLRRTQLTGGAVRFVRDREGGCAGAGSCSPPAAGTAELSGIGTRPAHRGRGVAAAVTAALTADLFARGLASAWLEPEDTASRRVYESVGFRPRGTRLHLALPAAGPAAANGIPRPGARARA
jgi:ribosomal protein S18 acetylase RimI-like enzyme